MCWNQDNEHLKKKKKKGRSESLLQVFPCKSKSVNSETYPPLCDNRNNNHAQDLSALQLNGCYFRLRFKMTHIL